MTALQRGQRLGSYVVEDLLGQGGMAEVYRATHTTLERHDAIKVLNPALNVDPTFPLRFEREAKTSARLRHPNIITVYDFGEQGDIAYLAMELATGGTFQERVGRFPTLVEAVEALEPICNAIEYAHSQGVIHRDLKPENILLDETQRRLLADFGLARIAAESIDLAESGLIVGTPQYMSPEQAMAAKVDHRADIYALGFIAYAAITGRVPYDARTFFGVIQQHLKSPPPSIAAVLPGIPAALDAAIRRATAKRPEDRFNRAAEFYAALRDAAETARDLPVGFPAVATPGAGATPAAGTPASPPGSLVARTVAVDAAAVRSGEQGSDTLCPSCGAAVRDDDRFCRSCGTPSMAARAGDGALPDRTVVLSVADLTAEADAGGVPPATALPAGGFDAALPPRRARHRPTSFNRLQWAGFALAALAIVAINVVGFWLTREGRLVTTGNVVLRAANFVHDNLPWFKSGLTVLGVGLATWAMLSMRAAIVDNRNLSPAVYRGLRQYHRLAGYSALTIAFAIGVFTCIGIFGFDVSTPRRLLHTLAGTGLLLVLILKVTVVRAVPSRRRYLKWIGQTVFVFWLLVLATSTIPWVYGKATGTGGDYGTPYGTPSGPYRR